MSKDVKVSIIVPVYNVEKYLERCLDSLVKQTLTDIEIICINDGSTDESAKILYDYAKKDGRIVVIHKANEGLSVARNLGVSKACGEYIGFVDSDDWIDLDFYEKLYNTAIEYNADIAAGEIIRLNEFHKKKYYKLDKITITENFEEKVQLCDLPDKPNVWNKIYKTSKIRQHSLKFIPNLIYEDKIYTPQALYNLERLVTVPNTSYYYYVRSNSIVRTKNKKAAEDLITSQNLAYEFYKQHNIDIEKYATKTTTYKFLGINVFRIQTKQNSKTYRIFNFIKWQKR